MRIADLATSVHILIESAEGVRNADAVAAVDGVDALHVGMNDLSVDLGHAVRPNHIEVVDACKRVIAAARGRGKLAAVGGAADAVQFRELLNEGAAPLIFAAMDSDVLAAGLSQRASEWGRRIEDWRGVGQSVSGHELP
jgi:2-keto-3-deoxy-L-rhamnonate aldolase RhmA